MTKEFYIFRHGESTYNVLGKIQGRTNDSELTEKGKQQAQKVGRVLRDKKIEVLISSPLKRAVQTAEIVNKFIHAPMFFDEHFTEVNVGIIEGLHYKEAIALYADDYAKWKNKDNKYPDFCFEGGETRRQVKERVFAGLSKWAEDPSYQKIAIASHGIMISQMMNALGLGCDSVENCSILHVGYSSNKWFFIEIISQCNEEDNNE